MLRTRRLPTLLLTLALLTAGFAACSDDGDGGATSDDDTTTSAGTGDASAATTVEMKEYAYVVDGEVPAGGGTIRISNTGEEFHMIGLARMRGGKTIADVRAAIESDSEDDDAATFDEAGLPGSFMGPGQSVDVTVPGLEVGNYAMICFLNVEGAETPHYARGMIGELRVVEGDAPAAPDADATYTAAPGRAIEGPAELDAGRRVIEITAPTDGSDLEPGIVKLDDGATIEQFSAATRQFDDGPLPEGAAGTLPGEVVIAMFDFGEETSVFLAVDLEPGTYVITAENTDSEDTPDVPVELIVVTVT